MLLPSSVGCDGQGLRGISLHRFAIAAIINDPTKEIDGQTLKQLMVPAAALLAKTR